MLLVVGSNLDLTQQARQVQCWLYYAYAVTTACAEQELSYAHAAEPAHQVTCSVQCTMTSRFHEDWQRISRAQRNGLGRYSGHRAVQLTHILPSAVWSMLIPLQLHPSMRQQYKSLHRASGMVFFCCAALMSFGMLFRKVLLSRQTV